MPAKPRVYIETSIISYLTARPSRDVIAMARLEITQRWWELRRARFELFVSQLVIEESLAGDEQAALRRMREITRLRLIDINDDAIELAEALMSSNSIPPVAGADMLHIAIATVNRMDFLLTWNHKHLANATLRRAVSSITQDNGYVPIVICTPDELMGDLADER